MSKSNIIVVASGKGGVGKSTFIAGVSRHLTENGKKVLAIDCDIGLRSLDLLFGYSEKTVFDWGDCIFGNCTVEEAIIHGEPDLLSAPVSYSDSFTPEALKELTDSLDSQYDFIFLDAPAGIGRGFEIAASCADKAVFITTPDSICVRSCARAYREAESKNISDCFLVINMFEAKNVKKGKLLNIDECIDETGLQLLGSVPLDRELAFSSVTGSMPGEFSPSDGAFFRISERLCGKRIPLSVV